MKQYLESVKSPRKIKVGNITRFKARNNKLFDTLKNVFKLNIHSIFSEKWIKYCFTKGKSSMIIY